MAKRTETDFKRRKNDAYDTPVRGMETLINFLPKKVRFIEPCAGKGNMIDFFESKGHICTGAYDIEPRRKDIKKMDVMEMQPYQLMNCDYIITNPPWTRKILHPMIERLSSIKPTYFLFDADWAFTKQAQPYLQYCEKIIALPRLKWIEGSESAAKDNCAWYLFNQPRYPRRV